MFDAADLLFGVASLSAGTETYQLIVIARGLATGWRVPAQPVLLHLGPSQSRNISVVFKTTDQATAVSRVTHQVQLVGVTDGSPIPKRTLTSRPPSC
jgi:hypothetical protein